MTIILLGVVGTLATSLMIGSMQTSRRQQEQTAALVNARVAMERMTADIRGANSLTYAAPRQLRFGVTLNGVRRTTTYTVVAVSPGSEIRRTVVSRNLSTAVETTRTTKVLGGMAIGRSEAIFTYTDGASTALTPLTTSPIAYAPGDVRTIGIRVVMSRSNDNPAELYQLVSIRNLED